MSYILDALKKSERERPPGAVPDLFTVHGPQPPAQSWPTRAIIVVAMLLVVPAIFLLSWIGTGRRDEGPGRTQPALSPQPRAEAPAAQVTLVASVASTIVAVPTLPASSRATAAVTAAARRPVVERTQTRAQPAPKSDMKVASPVAPVAIPAPPPSLAAPVPGTSAPATVPPPPQARNDAPSAPAQVGEMPSAVSPAPPAVTAPATVPPPAPEDTPPADGHVFDLAELPATVRAALPKLLVSGSVWSEEPSMRLLSVDDRLLHEGGDAAPGVNLREITPDGALFVYKGWHFRVAVGR